MEMTFNAWGETHTVEFHKKQYTNGNLAIEAIEPTEGPWCMVTTNFTNKLKPNRAYIDSNNCTPAIIKWLVDNGYAKETGNIMPSGFCVYEEYEFTDEFLNAI